MNACVNYGHIIVTGSQSSEDCKGNGRVAANEQVFGSGHVAQTARKLLSQQRLEASSHCRCCGWVESDQHFNVYALEMLDILFVSGFPNTGKSSVINSLKRSKACDTGSTPGVTKYIKTNLNSCSARHNSFNFLHQVCANSAVGQTHQAVGQSWYCRSWWFQPNATHSSKLHQSEMIAVTVEFQ